MAAVKRVVAVFLLAVAASGSGRARAADALSIGSADCLREGRRAVTRTASSAELARAAAEFEARGCLGQALRALDAALDELVDAASRGHAARSPEAAERLAELQRRARALEARLRLRAGRVVVDVSPLPVELRLDGQDAGKLDTRLDVWLLAGTHTLVFAAPGGVSTRLDIEVRAGELWRRSVVLLTTGPSRLPRGGLVVESDAGRVPVRVDGRDVGVTPLELRGIVAGRHHVEVGGAAARWQAMVDVPADATARVVARVGAVRLANRASRWRTAGWVLVGAGAAVAVAGAAGWVWSLRAGRAAKDRGDDDAFDRAHWAWRGSVAAAAVGAAALVTGGAALWRAASLDEAARRAATSRRAAPAGALPSWMPVASGWDGGFAVGVVASW